jgi:membrane associated rhomboid family serine protease
MSESAGVCYRHPNRESWVLCQRCGKTICGDCQISAAVGVHCPDCVKEQRPNQAKVYRVRSGNFGHKTPATNGLLAALAIGFVAQFLLGSNFEATFGFYSALAFVEPWRFITYAFLHSGIMHIAFNGYSLWVLGQIVERRLGTARFLTIFGVSAIFGAFAVSLLAPETFVMGASAAIFGLFAALLVINRGLAGSNVSLLVIIGINLVLGFVIPGISWQAHLGGLAGGFLSTIFVQQRKR